MSVPFFFETASRSQESYPISDLAPVMYRYLAWQASTSGVEQNFAKSERMKTRGQTPASAEFEDRALRMLLCKTSQVDMNDTVKKALQLYSRCHVGALKSYQCLLFHRAWLFWPLFVCFIHLRHHPHACEKESRQVSEAPSWT